MLTELLGRMLLSGQTDIVNPQQWFIDWANGGEGSDTSSGERITEENALRVPVVKAAVSVLSESMQTLPLEILRREKSGRISRATDHPVQELFFRQANDETSSDVWKHMTQMHLGTYGNSYSVIERSGRGVPTALHQKSPQPNRTKLVRGDDGKLSYHLIDKQGRKEMPVRAKDMLHIPYFSMDGLTGQSPVRLLREAIGGNKAAERFANEMFANGGTPQGHFRPQGSPREQASGRPTKPRATIPPPAQRPRTPTTPHAEAPLEPEKVQMTEARLFMLTEVARIYRITPHLLQELTHGTFTNIIELGRQFITFTMLPWMRLWTGEINRKLLDSPFFARFNPKEFLRGDPKVLAAWYRTMFSIGYYSLNDIRLA